MKNLITIGLLAGLCGCTASYTEPALPADHPANPSAPAAPPNGASGTLDLSDADPVTADTAKAEERTQRHDGGARTHEGMGESPPAGAAPALYACPMHPDVTSAQPGQKCPRCGMALVRPVQEKHP